MKKSHLLTAIAIALTFLLAPRVCAQDAAGAPALERADALFGEGVDLYRRAEYGPAATRFEAALDVGAGELLPDQRVRVLRALANCAYRRGDALEAVGWYTAALRHAPRDRQLWENVELARSDAGLPPADRGDLASTFDHFLHGWRPESKRTGALLAALLLSLALAVEILRGGRAARLVGLAGLAAVVLALPWFASFLPETADPHLVLRTSAVTVRSEPRSEMPAVDHLEPGAVVGRLDQLEGWIRIEGPGEQRGWVPADAVFRLER